MSTKLIGKNSRANWILLATLAILIGLAYRLYPLYIYPHRALQEKATIKTYESLKKTADQTIAKQYPHLEPIDRVKKSKELLLDYAKLNQKEIAQSIQSQAKEIPLEKPTSIYLMATDPYYYYRLTQQILQQGFFIKERNGRYYLNKSTLAPQGAWYPIELHSYTGAALFHLVHFFTNQYRLMAIVSWIPLFFAALSAILFLFLCRLTLKLPLLPSFVGALYLLLVPAFLMKSLIGSYDTDPYQIFFPLLIQGGLFLAFSASNKKRVLQGLLFSAIAVFLHSLFWRGWLLVFGLHAFALLLLLLITRPRKYISLYLIWLIFPFLLTLLFWGPTGLTQTFQEATRFITHYFQPSFQLWPDILWTISELHPASYQELIGYLGKHPSVIVAFLGILITLIQARSQKSSLFFSASLFLLFLILLSLPLAKNMVRFVILLVVPASLGVALGFYQLIQQLPRFFKSRLAQLGLCLAFLIPLGSYADKTIALQHPRYNHHWEEFFIQVRQETPPESIITSWWTPGHAISAFSERRVTFDGSSQNTPQAYWVAQFFFEQDEKKALSILRMLNTSGNQATELLTNQGMPLSTAIDLIHQALLLSDSEIVQLEQGKELLPLLRGTPPPSYLFVDQNLMDKLFALEYVAKRDFKKAEEFHASQKTVSHRENIQLMWDVADLRAVKSKKADEIFRKEDTVYFSNGVSLNLKTFEATIASNKPGTLPPKSIFYLKGNQLTEAKRTEKGALNLSILLLEENNHHQIILAHESLIRSMIFKLYYLKGKPLNHIQFFASKENLQLYQVNWNSF